MINYGQPDGPNFDYFNRNASRIGKLVLIPFGILVLLIIFATFVTRDDANRSGACGSGNQPGGKPARRVGNPDSNRMGAVQPVADADL